MIQVDDADYQQHTKLILVRIFDIPPLGNVDVLGIYVKWMIFYKSVFDLSLF